MPCPDCEEDWEDDEEGWEFWPGSFETYDRDGTLLDHRGRPIDKPAFPVGFRSQRA